MGSVLSTTVTVKLQVAILLSSSVAVAVTVVVPVGKCVPESWLYVMTAVSSPRSEAVATA